MGRIVFALRTVSLEMMSGHVQGSVLKLFVLFLSMSDVSLQMLDIHLFYSFEVMAKLRGVLATGEKRKY